ncbi:MAG: glycosyl transferase, partial [Actinomycetota bacterium]|nr:glycosyl transferase [Actinomycetota bacterium]
MTAPRILVVTVVHHPLDTRILVRQISALTAAGHEVTYAAPFAAFGVEPPAGVRALDLPRSSGRHRLSSVRTARQMIRQWAPEHDVVLIHDPELVVAAAGVTDTAVVWDVHEDTAVTVAYKDWIPRGLSRAAAVGVRGMERWAERHFSLLLAESAYAGRFRQPHAVVPNSTLIDAQAPLPGPGRAVCVSTLTRARGALDVIEVGRLLRPQGIVVDVIGPA